MTNRKHITNIENKPKIHFSTYGLVLFFLFLPFEYPLTTFGVGSILRYVGILVMGLAFVDVLFEKCKIYLDYRIVLLVIWLIYAYFSVLWCADVEGYNFFFSIYRNNALMFLFVTLVRYNKKEAEAIKYAFIAGIALLLLYMTFVPGAVTYSDFQNRLTLAAGDGEELIDQNYLIAIMSMPFGFVTYDIFNNKGRSIFVKLIEIVLVAGCFYYDIMSGSRSGLIAFIIIVILCAFRALKRNFLTVLIIALALVISIPYISTVFTGDVTERFTAEAMTGKTDESGSRLVIWEGALNALDGVELYVGYGAGSSETVIEKKINQARPIHNYVLAHLVELGVVGFLIFTSMLFAMYFELYKNGNRAVCIAFVGIIVESMFLDVLTTKFFWSALILLTIYITSSREDVKQNITECGVIV